MIKAGIIGATGYAGGELVRLLLEHREARLRGTVPRSYIDKRYGSIYRICSRSWSNVSEMTTWSSWPTR